MTSAADGGGAASDPLAAIQIVVMAKVPRAGTVKTRLARTLGPDAACALYAAWLRDLAVRLRATPARVTWAWAPATAVAPDLGPGFVHRGQTDGDLGERMSDAVVAAWADAACPVLVLGVDAPHVPVAWWQEAAAALLAGADVTLGPACDGGYWTIGLRRPTVALFAGIAWGGPTVYRDTVDRIRAAGLSLAVLPETFDVDDAEDLPALRAAVAADPAALRATAAVLARLAI